MQERLPAPPGLVASYPEAIEDICADCPLRGRPAAFAPGYGLCTEPLDDGETTAISLVDLAARWAQANKLSHLRHTVEVTLHAVTDSRQAARAFSGCEHPLEIEGQAKPACGAVALLLSGIDDKEIRIRWKR